MRSVKITAVVVAVAASAGAATLLWLRAYEWGPPVDPVHALAFVAALTVAARLVLDVRVRDETMSISLFEAVLVPALVAFPAPVVVALAVASQAISEGWQRVPPLKASFNVAQWALAAAAGSLVFRAAGGTGSLSGRTFAAAAAALTTMAFLNTTLFTIVVSIARGDSMRRVAATHAPANLLAWSVNGAFGALFLAAHIAYNATIVLFAVPLVALHTGLRGYAGAVADRRRLHGLHRATAALATPMNPLDGMQRFLDEARVTFRAAWVELTVAFPDGIRVYRSGDSGDGERLTSTVAVDATTTGALTVCDRVRTADGDHGDRTVLDAMARAAGSALQKALLLEQILDERHTLSDIVQHTSDGICTIDAGGIVRTWNPAFEAITGIGAVDAIGSRSLDGIDPRSESGARIPVEAWAEGAVGLPDMLEITDAGGHRRSLACSYTVVPGPDGRAATLIMVARDTTKAREVERMREDFVAAVSHELRTPLTPIKGFAETLLRHGETLPANSREEIARTIARQADRLERLITNLLEMTKVERGLRERPAGIVDVAAAAEKVVADFRLASSGRTIELHLPHRALAAGDSLWVEQVVSNLLSNALKYTPPATTISVVVEAAESGVALEVLDRGPGIPLPDHERVFERFRRLDDQTTRATGGAGIGLYIARRLARMMDGDLVVGPSEQGTRMILTLPAAHHLAVVG